MGPRGGADAASLRSGPGPSTHALAALYRVRAGAGRLGEDRIPGGPGVGQGAAGCAGPADRTHRCGSLFDSPDCLEAHASSARPRAIDPVAAGAMDRRAPHPRRAHDGAESRVAARVSAVPPESACDPSPVRGTSGSADGERTMIPALLGAYLIGSFPTGFLVVKWLKRVDLRTVGSGNIGATNVGRVAGTGASAAGFLIDAAKGGRKS